jgi:hypothetical protein
MGPSFASMPEKAVQRPKALERNASRPPKAGGFVFEDGRHDEGETEARQALRPVIAGLDPAIHAALPRSPP